MIRRAHRVRVSKKQMDAALAMAKEFEPYDRRAVEARYQAGEDVVNIRLDGGVGISIPRKYLQGLETATPAQLSKIEIVGNGTGLRWPLLDVDHYVPGLLAHTFGTAGWMRKIGRLGGLAKSKTKAAAARVNGHKGGRPRQKVSASST
jgi:hypothetical protein